MCCSPARNLCSSLSTVWAGAPPPRQLEWDPPAGNNNGKTGEEALVAFCVCASVLWAAEEETETEAEEAEEAAWGLLMLLLQSLQPPRGPFCDTHA